MAAGAGYILALTPEEDAELQAGLRSGMAGLFCAQCGRCREQCRHSLRIPTAMRSYMYAYGYRNPALAKDTLMEMARDDLTCRGCEACSVSCRMGLPVPARLRDIVRLLDVPDEFLG